MKKSMADRIEQYIKVLIDRSDNNEIIIQRAELAETFGCVPSQITYVVNTRFTEEDGYIAESRRGGKGHMRIKKCVLEEELFLDAYRQDFFVFIDDLHDKGQLSGREKELLLFLFSKGFSGLEPRVQGGLFRDVLTVLEEFFYGT